MEKDPQIEATFTDVDTLDITDRIALERIFTDNNFDLLINCAAYTAVDRAESDDLMAARLNTQAVGYMAEVASRRNVKMIHISTDYVFSGDSSRPYVENDEPYPHSIYGRTKLEGEGILKSFCPDSIIIRTAWLYSEYGSNFVKTMRRLGKEKGAVSVVSDQIGTPTYASDLADAVYSIIKSKEWRPGIYHFTDEGVASWYDFAIAIFEFSGMKDVKVTPIDTINYPTPARRPQYSVLSKDKIKSTFNISIPYWRDSLARCIAAME